MCPYPVPGSTAPGTEIATVERREAFPRPLRADVSARKLRPATKARLSALRLPHFREVHKPAIHAQGAGDDGAWPLSRSTDLNQERKMQSDRGFLDKSHADTELRRKAWQQGSLQYDRECWICILQKCSNVIGGWRNCPHRRCRRLQGCNHDSLICHAIARGNRPAPQLSPQQKADLKEQLVAAAAEKRARGEISDPTARLTQLAERALAILKQ